MECVLEPEFEVIIKRKGKPTILLQASEVELDMAYETKDIMNDDLGIVHRAVVGRTFTIKGRM